MSNAVGPVRKLAYDNKTIKLTNDNQINFWKGGFVNTESLNDIQGQTPKTEFIGGMITGLTSRCAAPGSLDALTELVKKTTVGDVDMVITLANGDKFSGAVFATADPTSFFDNQEGKGTFSLYARSGEFSPL